MKSFTNVTTRHLKQIVLLELLEYTRLQLHELTTTTNTQYTHYHGLLDLLFPNLARAGFCQISNGKSSWSRIFTIATTEHNTYRSFVSC